MYCKVVGFEFFTAVTMKNAFLWDLVSFGVVLTRPTRRHNPEDDILHCKVVASDISVSFGLIEMAFSTFLP
jgi:hypothetical protein